MFGLNMLNVFSMGRFLDTTTILWLRFVSLILIAIGIYIVYYDSISDTSTTYIQIAGWSFVLIGIISLLGYLLYGYYYVSNDSNSCIYCPSYPIQVRVNGTTATTPTPMNLPVENPFQHTALYYLYIDDIKPIPNSKPSSIIEKGNLYDIVVDGIIGEFGISPYEFTKSGKREGPTFFGNLPKQSLTQIAVIHDEKELRVFVNGIPRGSIKRENLPPTSSIDKSVLFNKDTIIRSGLIYQTELYSSILEPEDLFRQYEAMSIKYSNDSVYQNTKYPSQISLDNMTFTDKILGYIRLLGSLVGYSHGISVANKDILHINN